MRRLVILGGGTAGTMVANKLRAAYPPDELHITVNTVKHHLKAIREASKCVDRVFHAELHDLCENIIVTQAAEIE